MNEDNWFIIACLLAAPVVGFLFIAAWVKKKTCVTGTDFIVEQGNFLRGLWTILPESHQLAFWYIWLQHHRMFYDVFGRGHHWHNPELFDEGLTLLTKAIHTGIPVQQALLRKDIRNNRRRSSQPCKPSVRARQEPVARAQGRPCSPGKSAGRTRGYLCRGR